MPARGPPQLGTISNSRFSNRYLAGDAGVGAREQGVALDVIEVRALPEMITPPAGIGAFIVDRSNTLHSSWLFWVHTSVRPRQ